MRRLMRVFIATVAMASIFAGQATAAPIQVTSLDGGVGNFVVTKTSATTATVTFPSDPATFVNKVNGTSLGAIANFLPTGFNTINLSLSSTGAITGTSFTSPSKTVRDATGPGTTTFQFAAGSTNNSVPTALVVTGNETLGSSTSTAYDFGAFTGGFVGSFTLTLNAATSISSVLSGPVFNPSLPDAGGRISGTGSFSQLGDPRFFQQGTPVPEPATIASFAVMGVLGFAARRRLAKVAV